MPKQLALLVVAICAIGAAAWSQRSKTLEVYFIDVEGGQSTLFVTPTGESMLVDTGWEGDRDAGRIVGMAKAAGLSQIDYLVLTHYHGDHAGGVVKLAAQFPIKNFVDHGPNVEQALGTPKYYAAYLPIREKGKHILATPGEKLPITGINAEVISAAAETISRPLPGAGADNPLLLRFFNPRTRQKNPWSVARTSNPWAW